MSKYLHILRLLLYQTILKQYILKKHDSAYYITPDVDAKWKTIFTLWSVCSNFILYTNIINDDLGMAYFYRKGKESTSRNCEISWLLGINGRVHANF